MTDDDDPDRRLAVSQKLQEHINELAGVPPSKRTYHVHQHLMHAIDRIFATRKGHHFQKSDEEVIKDVASAILYTVDTNNRPPPPRGFFGSLWNDFRALSASQKAGAIAATVLFLLSALGGVITIYEKLVRPLIVTEQAWPPAAEQRTPFTPGKPEAK
jgi:hypothetical protein